MKYLIDGITKSVLSLANQYKSLREGDEYKVYDDTFSNIEGLDLAQTGNFYIGENGEKITLDQPDHDSRRMTMTNDFDSALEWCDCYVSFRSIPFELTNCLDLNAADEQISALLERIGKAKSLEKKIYLGNLFSKEFEEIAAAYENCINPKITKADLEEIKEYSYFYKGTSTFPGFRVSMIVGTNSSSGKFSCALKAKKHYEDLGEKVVLVHTEETYPFLDDQGGTVFGFCRNFSELTTDEDFTYFQSLIAKIYSEQRPDRIIFVTQAGFGLEGVVNSYQDTENGYKMKGLWDLFITRSFGLDSLIVSANPNRLDIAKRIIEYFEIQNAGVNAALVYVNPRLFGEGDSIVYTKEDKSEFYKESPLCNEKELLLSLNGFALEYPHVEIVCDYAGLTDKVKAFKSCDSFPVMSSAVLASKSLSEIQRRLGTEYAGDDVKKTLEEQHQSYSISDEDWKKIKELSGADGE